jgi:large subunit ribosomal protein L29
MKAKELKNQKPEQLTSELARLRGELALVSIKTKSGQQKNVRQAKALKKDIARIITVLTLIQKGQDK